MTVTVNNIQRTFNAPRISFSQVVLMGLYDVSVFERVNPDVTYSYRDGEVKCSGLMTPRSSLEVKPGMSFTVTNGEKRAPIPGPIKAADLKEFIIPEVPRVKVKPEALERRKAEFAAKGLLWPPGMTEEQKAAEVERVRLLMAPHEARYQAEQALKSEAQKNKQHYIMEDEPILIVMDKDGYLVQAGQPSCLSKKDAYRYALEGYTMKTITIKEYRASNFKWIYDKPKS